MTAVAPATAPDDTGRTQPLTVITPVKPGRTPWQRLVFELLPLTPGGRSDDLLELSFVQSARWTLITGLPWNGAGQVPERLRYDYLLFESNFNGSFDAYIEAFADVMPDRMRRIWGTSFGFPGPLPVRPFLKYIRRNDFGADHFYSAYPQASNTEVLAALHVQGPLSRLRAVAPCLDPGSFRRRYDAVLSGTQARPAPLLPKKPARANLCGQTYAFTALTPIDHRRVESLCLLLKDIASESPFAYVPGVHFARWVVIDDARYQGAGQQRDSWRNSYLLTTTTTDDGVNPVDHLFETLGTAADRVWEHCVGYPGRSDRRSFGNYLRRNQIRTNRFFSGYPHASVDDVIIALDAHARLLDFAYRHRGSADEARLRADFLTEFAPTVIGGTP